METFYARLMAAATQDDALLAGLAQLTGLDRSQIKLVSASFTWNGW